MLSSLRSYTGRASSYPSPSISATSPATSEPEPEPSRRRRSDRRQLVTASEQATSRSSSLRNHQNAAATSTTTPSIASEAPVGGWLPAFEGSTFISATPTELFPDLGFAQRVERAPPGTSSREENTSMTRRRSITTPASPSLSASAQTVPRSTGSVPSNSARSRHGSLRVTNPAPTQTLPPQLPISQLPSIRFVPYSDPRSPRPSLAFPTITRTLPNNASTIRVGRYSEKDSVPPDLAQNPVSDAPVGFKSKVVSRRHCEFFYLDNQWHVKDVKSSSGTFLNHIRLSPPGEESKPYAIKDGDLVQLGIDFKGGEEMIFRCVKIRILCNRGWQKSVNKFNKSAHKQLNDLARGSSKEFKESTECTICLNSIAPCQSLFVAPCSHTWHYKCIRPMLEESNRLATGFAQFLCPNCRSVTDLNADVDEGPLWEDDFSSNEEDNDEEQESFQAQPGMSVEQDQGIVPGNLPDDELSADLDSLSLRDGYQHPAFGLPPAGTSLSRRSSSRGLNPSASAFVPISSSPLPMPSASSIPRNSLDLNLSQLPAVGSGTSMPQQSTSPNGPSQTPIVPNSDDARTNSQSTASPIQIRRREDETVSSPDSSHGTADDFGLAPLDQTMTITSMSLPRTISQPLSLSSRNNASGGDQTDTDGPMTPRNNAGPFVFDGAAAAASAVNPNSRPPEGEI